MCKKIILAILLINIITINTLHCNDNKKKKTVVIDAGHGRITSYNVCYTKLLRKA